MKLIQMELQDFGPYESEVVEFPTGVTALVGPVGSGKSTLQWALSWCLFGSGGVKVSNDRLVREGAAESGVRVATRFETPDGVQWVVTRKIGDAELERVVPDAGSRVVEATGATAVTARVEDLLGMDYKEFPATHLTRQKELLFLEGVGKGPTDRGRFVNRVLGFDAVKSAERLARDDLNKNEGSLAAMKQSLEELPELPDTEVVAAAEKSVDEKEAELKDLESAERAKVQARQRVRDEMAELDTKAQEYEKLREEAFELRSKKLEQVAARGAELDRERQELMQLQAEMDEAAKSVDLIGKQYDGKGPESRLAELEDARRARLTKMDKETRLKSLAEERGRLKERVEGAESRRKELHEEQERLSRVHAEHTRKIAEIQQELDETTVLVDGLKHERGKIRNEIQVHSVRLERLKEIGPDGACDTCEQPLGRQWRIVVHRLGDAIEDAEGRLAPVEEALKELEASPLQMRMDIGDLKVVLNEVREQKQELAVELGKLSVVEEVESRLEAIEREMLGLQDALEKMPEAPDLEEVEKLRGRVAALQRLEAKHEICKDRIAQKRPVEEIESDRAEVEGRVKFIKERLASLEDLIRVLDYDPIKHSEMRTEERGLSTEIEELVKRKEGLRQDLSEEVAKLVAMQDLKSRRDQLEESVEKASRETVLLNSVVSFLGAFRGWLNNRVRPMMSDRASEILSDMTAGAMAHVELTESYEVRPWKDGRPMPNPSGGESDMSNLAMRLALSEILAERSGQALQMVWMDEVFAHLDSERTASVMEAIVRLNRTRFPQVVVTTHDESVKHLADNLMLLTPEARGENGGRIQVIVGGSNGEKTEMTEVI